MSDYYPSTVARIKNLTIALLNYDSIVVVADHISGKANTLKVKGAYKSIAEQQRAFCDYAYSEVEDDDYRDYEAVKKAPEPLTKNGMYLTNRELTSWLNQLESLELVRPNSITVGMLTREDSEEDVLTDAINYTISSKGLEVALKLQEHIDNKRRFEQQKSVSLVMKRNSTKSVATGKVALVLSVILILFGGFRVYQLERKILSHEVLEQRIHDMGVEVFRLNDEMLPLMELLDKPNKAASQEDP
jgi:hypothetical protein